MVTRSGAVFSDFDGDTIAKTPTRVTWDPIAAEKGGYKHFMLKEIYEQPAAVRDTVLGRVSLETGTIFPDETGLDDAMLRAVERVTLIACGTSWHAALVGKFLIEELARIPVEVDYGSSTATAGRWPTARHAGRGHHPVGRDRRHAGRAARGPPPGRPQPGDLQRRRQHGHARERRARSTPTPARRSASPRPRPSPPSWSRCTCWRCTWRRPAARSSAEQRKSHIAELLQLPQQIEHVLKCAPQIEDIASRFHSRSDFLYLGRGINYPIALEGALKLKEISYIHAEGYPAGEMKHGPIALIDEQMPVVAIAPHDHVFEKMLGNIQEVKARGGSVIALTTAGDDALWRLLDRDDRLDHRRPGDVAAAGADRHHRAAAAARLPHRRAARLRRRPAAEPGEERDGRIGAGDWGLGTRACRRHAGESESSYRDMGTRQPLVPSP